MWQPMSNWDGHRQRVYRIQGPALSPYNGRWCACVACLSSSFPPVDAVLSLLLEEAVQCGAHHALNNQITTTCEAAAPMGKHRWPNGARDCASPQLLMCCSRQRDQAVVHAAGHCFTLVSTSQPGCVHHQHPMFVTAVLM